MSQEILVGIDTETGGLDCTYNALLSIAVHAENYHTGEVLFSREFRIKGDYVVSEECPAVNAKGNVYVSPKALAVNKLDIKELSENGMDLGTVDMLVNEAIETLKLNKNYKVIPIGQNLKFDLGFILNNLPRTYRSVMGCRYHRELSSAMTVYHTQNGKSYDTSVSLDNVRKELGIVSSGQTHSALVDAQDTIKAWKIITAFKASV